eukprot:CAMPEP_0114546808 /NCGR_PEP_ID=MMETSP0114-20121206/4129_1 /TAXON_ID=31324 /ORGANISM="Goniomonas sp, Strain m" /LENGTH=146 /DNA_ID=CAMNT_0001731323 /DNA_START=126 /DNA_END=566 /DNA_ORIENTATION=+
MTVNLVSEGSTTFDVCVKGGATFTDATSTKIITASSTSNPADVIVNPSSTGFYGLGFLAVSIPAPSSGLGCYRSEKIRFYVPPPPGVNSSVAFSDKDCNGAFTVPYDFPDKTVSSAESTFRLYLSDRATQGCPASQLVCPSAPLLV